MRTFALQNHPELAARLAPGFLPIIGAPFGGQFDGVVSSAVMMHVPEHQLLSAWKSIRSMLEPNGRVLFSLPSMRPDLLKDDRDKDSRFFKNHPPAFINSLLTSLGFSQIELGGQATSEYSDISWTIFLFALNAHPVTRA
jgi:SAM-dependent methyltransferase